MSDTSKDKAALEVSTKIHGASHAELRAPFSITIGELARLHQRGPVVFSIESKHDKSDRRIKTNG